MSKATRSALTSLALVLAMGISGTASAGVGIGAKAGTMGLGAELTVGIGDHLAVRAGAYQYDYDYESTEGDIDYNMNADLDKRALYLDLHPFAGVFRLTAGLVENGTSFTGVATSTGTIDVGGTPYNTADIGELHATLDWSNGDERVPYFGIGWSKSPSGTGFGFSLDLGIVKAGKPKASLFTVNGDPTITGDPTFQANLAAEQQEFQDDADEFDTYPVVALGLSYHF